MTSEQSPNDQTVPAEVELSREGRLGHILLSRPRAINALTHGMVSAIARQLREWEVDPSIETVVISGAGDRGLCAGGDIVGLYREITGGRDGALRFWADEYALNLQIARYPKPYVAIMDGIVLGGGVGVSAHGSVRVVTERTKIGMPEVGIGFVPDVGGTWLLAHAAGELGTHAGLTGGSFTGADALELGLADHFVTSDRLPDFLAYLTTMPVEDALSRVASDTPASELAASRHWIDACYSSNDAVEIVGRLESSTSAAAREAAAVIRSKSPLAVAVTLESLRRARRSGSLAETLKQEFRVSAHCAAGTEMVEGIRAQVIDKDRQPRWAHATLQVVSASEVERFFTPSAESDGVLAL